jgi:hypothetical protein
MKLRLKLIIFCLLFCTVTYAQNWGGGVDDEPLHFGFTFQYISSEYKILKKANWQDEFEDPEGPFHPHLPLASELALWSINDWVKMRMFGLHQYWCSMTAR